MKLNIFIGLLFLNTFIFAQNITISGYVRDSLSQEDLIGATIENEDKTLSAVTNEYGYFTLKLPKPSVITFRYVGYQAKMLRVSENTNQSFPLSQNNQLQEVQITANKVNYLEAGKVVMPVERLKLIPSIAGEADIMKALQLTPGVQSGAEGTAAIFVRGGTPDQNLVLLDGATVYNANHLFGFLSIFNPNAIKSLSFLKGNFPARHGGRLASVIEVSMKEGNKQKIAKELSIGLISSSFNIEGPIKKERSSFLLSGRTAYPGLISYLAYLTGGTGQGYVMYDLNMKINHKINEKEHIFLSAYAGSDALVSSSFNQNGKDKSNLKWGNETASVRYTKEFNSNLFGKIQATYSNFAYINSNSNEDRKGVKSGISKLSGVKELSVTASCDYKWHTKHFATFGVNSIFQAFKPNFVSIAFDAAADSLVKSTQKIQYANSTALFFENKYKISKFLELEGGIRSNFYNTKGKTYAFLEPRALLKATFNEHFATYLSYAKLSQFLHLLTRSTTGPSNDIWVPSTDKTPPQTAQLYAIGTDISFPKQKLFFSIEGYYKQLNAQIDYQQGVGVSFSEGLGVGNDWESIIERSGIGEAYGVEFFMQKEKEKWDAMFSYTLSWSNRKFEHINNGTWYPLKYDRRHNLSFTGLYKFSKKWRISSNWIFNTGFPITMPIALQNDLNDQPNLVFDGRNNARMPNYHRLDINLIKNYTNRKGRSSQWVFGVYNAYLRSNPAYLTYNLNKIKDLSNTFYFESRPNSVFKFIPSVSYNVKF